MKIYHTKGIGADNRYPGPIGNGCNFLVKIRARRIINLLEPCRNQHNTFHALVRTFPKYPWN
jgi:hypothetical protein